MREIEVKTIDVIFKGEVGVETTQFPLCQFSLQSIAELVIYCCDTYKYKVLGINYGKIKQQIGGIR